MHNADTALDAQRAMGASLDRRGLVKGCVALGALALVAPITGCSILGIEDPTATQEEEPADVPGTVDFENLVVALNLDTSSWVWSQFPIASSPNYGSLVVSIPVTATNNGDSRRILNGMYCKVLGPDGTPQEDISTYYAADDILQRGGIAAGAAESGVVHILYKGPGTYTLEFDNLLGRKADLAFTVDGTGVTGLRPIPEGSLSASDASVAIPYGVPFSVGGLSLTFAADEASYFWSQTWDEADQVWNGRWCVGVPLTVTNATSAPLEITTEMYGLYAPGLYKIDDASPWFAGRDDAPAVPLAYIGPVAPGQTVQSVLYWIYIEDGTYYAVFDSNGQKVVTSVHFVNS